VTSPEPANDFSPIVVSNVALVLQGIIAQIQERIPGINYVYDEALSYETALRRYRTNQEITGEDKPFIPAWAFRRQVLKHDEHGMARRAPSSLVCSADNPGAGYKAMLGELTVEFLYIDTRMAKIEEFEISYLADSIAAEDAVVYVDMPGIDENFPYYITHNPLENAIIQIEDNYYKALQGSMTVRGAYLLFLKEYPLIQEINLGIKSFNEAVLAECTITGV